MTPLVPLIELLRGGTPESVHFGAVAVADAQGKVLARAGDPHRITFTRSTLKALQALPFMQAGGPKAMGFSQRKPGDDVRQPQRRAHARGPGPGHAGQGGAHLQDLAVRLPCADLCRPWRRAGAGPGQYDERHHNCSGKHAGFLAHCVQQGWPVGNYLAPGHPLQQAIRREVARAVGLAPEDLKMGIDGCSAPNYAMPLASLARGYARLASGLSDPEFGESFVQLADAMTSHPELVSGTARSDLAFMRAGRGDWVTKAGADGVQVVASRSRGQAFALKIADGNSTGPECRHRGGAGPAGLARRAPA